MNIALFTSKPAEVSLPIIPPLCAERAIAGPAVLGDMRSVRKLRAGRLPALKPFAPIVQLGIGIAARARNEFGKMAAPRWLAGDIVAQVE